MYFFLILFFVSLLGIIFMIVKKLAYLNHEEKHIHDHEVNFLAEILDWNKVKHTSLDGLKKVSHIFLWVILRTYIISSNFVITKSKLFFSKIKEKIFQGEEAHSNKEPSKYLKIISEYRQKIKHLKHKIKEEEGIE